MKKSIAYIASIFTLFALFFFTKLSVNLYHEQQYNELSFMLFIMLIWVCFGAMCWKISHPERRRHKRQNPYDLTY